MSAIFLSILLLTQGIPSQQGGTVTGVLRDSQGMPVAGIRIAAMARDNAPLGLSEAVMAGIALTDEEGRFTLENIPPGRYVVAAGRLDRHTYFPGTQNLSEATVLAIVPGATIRGINFVLNATSSGRAPEIGRAWARRAAYQDIFWPADKPEVPRVLLDGKWYELLSIENLPVKELIEYARRMFTDHWQKRFEEDMVEILAGLGRPTASDVSLGLVDLETRQTLTRRSPMNANNRSQLMNAKNSSRPSIPIFPDLPIAPPSPDQALPPQ